MPTPNLSRSYERFSNVKDEVPRQRVQFGTKFMYKSLDCQHDLQRDDQRVAHH